MQTLDLADGILVNVETSQLGVLFETEKRRAAVALEVQGLQLRKELHTSDLAEAFEVEIEALIELESAIVVLPVLAEEVEEPLLGQLVADLVIVILLRRGVVSQGESWRRDTIAMFVLRWVA